MASVRGWCWLGVVLSVLWFVGFGGWLWLSNVGGRDGFYSAQLERCYRDTIMKQRELKTDDAQYDQNIANLSRDYYTCTERIRASFDSQMDAVRSHVWNIVADTRVLVAICLLVLIGPWIAARFREEA